MGKAADLVVRDASAPELQPMLNVPVNLVLGAPSRGIRHVLVDGRVVVEDGRLATLDTRAVVAGAAEAARRVHDRAGVPTPRWPVRTA